MKRKKNEWKFDFAETLFGKQDERMCRKSKGYAAKTVKVVGKKISHTRMIYTSFLARLGILRLPQ